jgi:hypothetical protein
MRNLESILNAEKSQQHQLDNPDLLAFSVLTEIARLESKARLRTRLIAGLALALAASAIIIQLITLSAVNIDLVGMVHGLARRINDNPFLITSINLGLATIILITRKQSLF